jgi:sporulation protein YlmC with PRC-barrel domain
MQKFDIVTIISVIGRSVGVLNEVLMQLQTVAVSTGLVIHTTKTKYMRRKETIGEANTDIKQNGQIFMKGSIILNT